MMYTLATFFTSIDKDDRVKAVVLTSTGKVFSAGVDLNLDTSHFKASPTRTHRDPGGTLALAMYNCSKPVIVAFNGLALGIGMTATLAATIR
jgi:enoyl-CoA hydratase/carnithine racemase